MKKLLLLLPMGLAGCAVTEWLVQNEEAVSGAAGTAADVGGPYGAIAGLGITTLLGFAKWYEHKSNAGEVIASIQATKENLPPDAKKKLREGLVEYMPEKAKAYVAKVKAKL